MKSSAKFLFLSIFILLQCKAFAENTMQVQYWDWGKTPIRDDFQFALLRLILEETKDKYGGYELQRVTAPLSTARVRRELNRGKLFNVQIAPWRPILEKEPISRIDVDLYKGLLGCRLLIIRKEDLKQFAKVKTLKELQVYTAGVGRGWVDADVFLHNGFTVNSGASFDTLLPMLSAKRFDFVSLGVMEARELLSQSELGQTLITIEAPLIYMPLPFVVYVNNSEPLLAKRIAEGLELVTLDGSYDVVFERTYGQFLQYVRKNRQHFILLKNNTLPESMRQTPEFIGLE